ncbi:MAG: hypothetical protein AAGF45_09380 [Pseudomonadota bacterium]
MDDTAPGAQRSILAVDRRQATQLAAGGLTLDSFGEDASRLPHTDVLLVKGVPPSRRQATGLAALLPGLLRSVPLYLSATADGDTRKAVERYLTPADCVFFTSRSPQASAATVVEGVSANIDDEADHIFAEFGAENDTGGQDDPLTGRAVRKWRYLDLKDSLGQRLRTAARQSTATRPGVLIASENADLSSIAREHFEPAAVSVDGQCSPDRLCEAIILAGPAAWDGHQRDRVFAAAAPHLSRSAAVFAVVGAAIGETVNLDQLSRGSLMSDILASARRALGGDAVAAGFHAMAHKPFDCVPQTFLFCGRVML